MNATRLLHSPFGRALCALVAIAYASAVAGARYFVLIRPSDGVIVAEGLDYFQISEFR